MNIKVSTILSIGMLILALVFATLGFYKAGDSLIAPLGIASYMGISAIFFAILGIRGVRRKELWQRLLGVGAITAAVYMLVMAVACYIMLDRIQMPEF
ncbi:MAG: hypothetical protein JXB07_11815 [Anaerolineae bacterium]|nr:hypothetical protein [Anaerolineae bacterium]